jgi:hypothetical protein
MSKIFSNVTIYGTGSTTGNTLTIKNSGSTSVISFKENGYISVNGTFVSDSTNSDETIISIKDNSSIPIFTLNKNGGLAIGLGSGNGALCADSTNLRAIPRKENLSKGANSLFTAEILLANVTERNNNKIKMSELWNSL